ncbi:hypothetical protein [Pseudomonas atagonensis]|uniref:hypothetical protein n=1 Tax=Pseudomonas atagonensis TaxID=2609964 RepID=UPI0015B54DDF|nr:hypothetical protein [Pseudomonas atagonensis]
MRSHEARVSVNPIAPVADSRARQKTDFKSSHKTTGAADMEPRVIELETHLQYIRRDMDEVKADLKSIKHRLAYSAGATAVILCLLGWVANSRFEQLVTLISH